MAITATNRGTGADSSAGTSLVVSPSSTIAAGSTAILCLAMDNANGSSTNMTALSYTDSVGNVWYQYMAGESGVANANASAVVYIAVLATQLTSSDTLTLGFAVSTTAKAWTLIEAAPASGNIVIFIDGVVSSSSTSGTPSVTTDAITNGDLVVGFCAAESADSFTGDSDTTNGSWSTKQSIGTGSGTTGISICTQQKVVTATGTQIYNPTLTSADQRTMWFSLTEADAKARMALTSATIAEASSVFKVRRPLAAGSLAVLVLAADNMGTNGGVQNIPNSLTDTQSNTWTLRQTGIQDPGAAGAGVELGIYTSVLTTALGVTDTITATYVSVNVNGKAAILWEFAPQSGGTLSYVQGGMGTGASTGTPTVTTSSITNGNYVIGAAGAEQIGSFVGDADTTNGSWKSQLQFASGITQNNAMSVASQWKLVTSSGAQTYNPTLTTGDVILGWIEITETVGNTAKFLGFFF